MELVGQILKKNRENKKLKILDVSKELNISEEVLYNIENNYLQNNIDIVFFTGHVRAYCSFLNLDENKLVRQFKEERLSNENKNIEIKRPRFQNFFLFQTKLYLLVLF